MEGLNKTTKCDSEQLVIQHNSPQLTKVVAFQWWCLIPCPSNNIWNKFWNLH